MQSSEHLQTMFDSEEEFDSIIAKGPNEVVGKFMKELPTDLRDGAAPLSNFTKVGFLARGSFGKLILVVNRSEGICRKHLRSA